MIKAHPILSFMTLFMTLFLTLSFMTLVQVNRQGPIEASDTEELVSLSPLCLITVALLLLLRCDCVNAARRPSHPALHEEGQQTLIRYNDESRAVSGQVRKQHFVFRDNDIDNKSISPLTVPASPTFTFI